ncbi:hypothetical protein CPB85DRAFT_1333248 [Mucidula mucida]|nr:hypothetical protein CPB85DRAFT_1333248 [Mucidula mucida]
MSTTATTNTQLCAFCQRKPRHGGFEYCGKTCAKQASTLCGNCHQKPKFAGHDYCSKKCGAAAGASAAPIGTSGVKATPGASNATQPPSNAQVPGLDLTELAKTIIQQLQAQGGVNSGSIPQQVAQILGGLVGSQFTAGQHPPQPNGTAAHASLPRHAAQQAPSAAAGHHFAGGSLPGQVDAQGYPIDPDYGHAQPVQFTVQGYNAPAVCIMCGMKPQSDRNYFCGDECKERALSKDY